jgi:hypothetical protein
LARERADGRIVASPLFEEVVDVLAFLLVVKVGLAAALNERVEFCLKVLPAVVLHHVHILDSHLGHRAIDGGRLQRIALLTVSLCEVVKLREIGALVLVCVGAAVLLAPLLLVVVETLRVLLLKVCQQSPAQIGVALALLKQELAEFLGVRIREDAFDRFALVFELTYAMILSRSCSLTSPSSAFSFTFSIARCTSCWKPLESWISSLDTVRISRRVEPARSDKRSHGWLLCHSWRGQWLMPANQGAERETSLRVWLLERCPFTTSRCESGVRG